MSVSSATAAWIAIGAAAGAAVAVGAALWVWSRVRRLREGQAVLLGGGKTDLVDFAVSLQARIDDLHRAVDEIAAGLVRVDRRIDQAVANTSIVRYDAYEDTGGHQSASLAVLDSARSGVVVTAIQGRDYARIYMKELDRGHASIALSPEEAEAVERAMSR
jgi:HAMP domain-containing protein